MGMDLALTLASSFKRRGYSRKSGAWADKYCMKTNKPCGLLLEPLESRRLLATVFEGVEPDGDLYEVKLSGAGTMGVVDLDMILVVGTNSHSRLSVTVTQANGDGVVAVGQVHLGQGNLGRLIIEGDLGGLTVGNLGRLDALSLGKVEGNSGQFDITGKAGLIKAKQGIFNSEFTIAGNVGRIEVGGRKDGGTDIHASHFDIGGNLKLLTLKQSLTANSTIDVAGDLKVVKINKSLVSSQIAVEGEVKKIGIDGRLSLGSEITVGGDLRSIKVKKSVSDSTMAIGGSIRSAIFGDDVVDSLILADSIRSLKVTDDFENSQLSIATDLGRMRIGDSRGLTLRVQGSTGTIKVQRSLDSALFSILHDVGNIFVGGDLNRTTIMGGIDIGEDFLLDTADDAQWGDLFMLGLMVKGDMIDSSISAGISPNGLFFGDGNDTSTMNHIGTARILKVIVRGEILSTQLPGESYAISADDGINRIKSQGQEFLGSDGVIIQEF
jgi:hypothetical protein